MTTRRPAGRRMLLTGMSATGKSTLVAALQGHGVAAVDLDEPPYSGLRPLEAGGAPDWVWDEDAVAALLDDASLAPLVVAGCAPNQGRFRARFDVTVLLTASEEVTLERLRTRTTNAFGKDPAEQAKVLDDTRVVVPLLRAVADVELDTDAPFDEVLGQVLDLLGSDDAPTAPDDAPTAPDDTPTASGDAAVDRGATPRTSRP